MASLHNNSSRSDSAQLNRQTSPDSAPQADDISVVKRTDQSGSLGKGLDALFEESGSETSNLSGFPIPVSSDEEKQIADAHKADKTNAASCETDKASADSNKSAKPIEPKPDTSESVESKFDYTDSAKSQANSSKTDFRRKSTNRLKFFGIATAWTLAVACITAAGTLWITSPDPDENNIAANGVSENSATTDSNTANSDTTDSVAANSGTANSSTTSSVTADSSAANSDTTNNVTADSLTTNSVTATYQKAFVQCLGDDISNVIQSQNEQIEQTAKEINKQAIEAKSKNPKAWKKYHFCN